MAALLALLLSSAFVHASGTNSQQFTLQQFEADLRKLERHAFKTNVSSQDVTILRLAAEGALLPKDSWAAILQLWVLGKHDFVQRLWWQKEDSQTRAFIVSLEWCMVAVPPKNSKEWPVGISCYEADALRFESAERAMRLKETDFVREHYSVIAQELAKILSTNAIEWAKRYEGFSKSSEQRAASRSR